MPRALASTGAGASAFTGTVSNTSMLIHARNVLTRSVPLPVRTTLLLGLLARGRREVPPVPQRATSVFTDVAAHRDDFVAATRVSNPDFLR